MFTTPTHFATTVSISPDKAQAFDLCGLYFAEVFSRKKGESDTPHALFGTYLHAAVKRFNDLRIAGSEPDIDALSEQVAPRFLDGSRDEDYIRHTRSTLLGWRAMLDEQGLRLVSAGVFLRTPSHPVRDRPTVGWMCSAKLDALTYRECNGSLVALDLKPHVPNSLDWYDSVEMWCQGYVVRSNYPESPVEVAHVATAHGNFVNTAITDELIDHWHDFADKMALAMASQQFPAMPGQHCQVCAFRSHCPTQAPCSIADVGTV
jgi:PD-(D/E)XK nuclease superfamily